MQKVVEINFLDLNKNKNLLDFAENVIQTCFKEEKLII